MSFDKLDIKDNEAKEGRQCIIVCNIGGKELQKVKNCAMILGIRDNIIITAKDGDNIVKDVLENNINSNCEEGRRDRAILFNSIAPSKMNMFLENLKKVRINNVLKAVVTETSINWTINEVLENLAAERIALSKGDFKELHK